MNIMRKKMYLHHFQIKETSISISTKRIDISKLILYKVITEKREKERRPTNEVLEFLTAEGLNIYI